ncbi:potassium-transporting ATPase subunit F [Anabaena sp. FACHB-1237]|uniref:potassium-transporting ATPase subunit F n=1 Tax=Anabaena sp. FACHB-1237 TaxID=2692769 RepID=UPI00168007F7|nr:potassium-transporting ATPase subunit F [Anabaena sp. FACHB-1237]MBD2137860.1 potassium-transporting ATPase subunit F [Anabaena sp. FACHB-1237]
MVFKVSIFPLIYGNTTNNLDSVSRWAVGLLVFTALMLVVYLLTVIFTPERF